MINPVYQPGLTLADYSTQLQPEDYYPDSETKKGYKKALRGLQDELKQCHDDLYADQRHAVLLIFQGMDTAGKDSTVKRVVARMNPSGCFVYSFGRPSETELKHDFLWRIQACLPERGHLSVFNRSHYEDVLVTRVHPELLHKQHLRQTQFDEHFWQQRFDAINAFEQHLVHSGTTILKFWLHLGQAEQKQRLLARLDNDDKNWKFEENDIRERQFWSDYQQVASQMLQQTHQTACPWHVIPADDKKQMRLWVSRIVLETMKSLPLKRPQLSKSAKEHYKQLLSGKKV